MSRLMSAIGGLLVRREVVLERVLELLLPVRVGAEGVARHGLARGVELQQLLRHVAHGLLDARLRRFPRGAAELVERRLGGAGVLLDEVEPLDRHEELVVAGVAQLHELLRAPSPTSTICFSPTNGPMPWSTCTTRSPTFEVAEVRQERAGRRRAAARARGAPPRRRPPRRRFAGRRRAGGIRATVGRRRRAPPRRAHPRRDPRSAAKTRSREPAPSCARRDPVWSATNTDRARRAPSPPDFGDPVLDAPVELRRGLAATCATPAAVTGLAPPSSASGKLLEPIALERRDRRPRSRRRRDGVGSARRAVRRAAPDDTPLVAGARSARGASRRPRGPRPAPRR